MGVKFAVKNKVYARLRGMHQYIVVCHLLLCTLVSGLVVLGGMLRHVSCRHRGIKAEVCCRPSQG